MIIIQCPEGKFVIPTKDEEVHILETEKNFEEIEKDVERILLGRWER